MKRQSPASSMKRWIAHGPASEDTFGWSSSPSFQKHNAERKAKSRMERKLNTTGSAGACACAHASTVLVVPKSMPSVRGPVALSTLAHDLDAGLRVHLAQLLLDLGHVLLELRPGRVALLELVVGDVLLPARRVLQAREELLPVSRGLVGLLRRRHDRADLWRGMHIEARFLERRSIGVAGQALVGELREHADLAGA